MSDDDMNYSNKIFGILLIEWYMSAFFNVQAKSFLLWKQLNFIKLLHGNSKWQIAILPKKNVLKTPLFIGFQNNKKIFFFIKSMKNFTYVYVQNVINFRNQSSMDCPWRFWRWHSIQIFICSRICRILHQFRITKIQSFPRITDYIRR